DRDGGTAHPDGDGSGRTYAATPDRGEVRVDSADPRRGPGQGARVAAPARDRVRGSPRSHGGVADLLGGGARAAARSGRLQQDAQPVEGTVVLPRTAGAADDVPPDDRGRDDPRHRSGPAG